MYQISLSQDERELVLLNLYSRIIHLRDMRDECHNDIWENSIFSKELVLIEGLYEKISDSRRFADG